LVSLSYLFFSELVVSSCNSLLGVFSFFVRSDALSPLEVLDKLLAANGSTVVLVHQLEELFD